MGFSSLQILWRINSCLVWFPWWLRHGAMDPFEGTPFGETLDWPDFRIYSFNLVIRLSKVKQSAFFRVSPAVVVGLNYWPLLPGTHLLLRWSRCLIRETSFLSTLLEWQSAITAKQHVRRQQACPLPAGMVFLVILVRSIPCALN